MQWRILGACTGVLECLELGVNRGWGSVSDRYEEWDGGYLEAPKARGELQPLGPQTCLLFFCSQWRRWCRSGPFLGLAVLVLVQR